MHELFKQVLNERDLSRAGDLFSLPDCDIVNDLAEVLKKITEISSQPDYKENDNDQSVVEICVTRVTSCVRETDSVETHCVALVGLLEACLHHNLRPLNFREDDPPHAKIASDIISCIFSASDNHNYSNAKVMETVLPVAVKYLHKGNRELARNMARYLSLAVIHHAKLLKPHVNAIMDSIVSGNYPLIRVLTHLYEVCPEPIGAHTTALVALFPHAEPSEKLALLTIFEWQATSDPDVLEASVGQLIAYMCSTPANAWCDCMGVLKVLLCLSKTRPNVLIEHCAALRRAARAHPGPQPMLLVAQVVTRLGHANKARAQEALNFVLECLAGSERAAHAALLREASALCRAFPALFTERVVSALRARHGDVKQTPRGVTIVKLGGPHNGTAPKPVPPPSPAPPPVPSHAPAPPPVPPPVPPPSAAHGYTRRTKLGDSRSTGRLHNANTHRSMTRLNIAGGSVGGLHKSMTRLTSTQQINLQLQSSATQANLASINGKLHQPRAAGGVTVTTVPQRAARPARHHHHNIFIGHAASPPPLAGQSISVNPLTLGRSAELAHQSVTVTNIAPSSSNMLPLGSGHMYVGPSASAGPVTVTSRRNNTSVTMINSNTVDNHRISVFEPYPMRDTVQHFCEKHLDKIRAYMDNVAMRLPQPTRCTIEERRSKKTARLQFGCGRRGAHCLYARATFCVRTRSPRVWVHLMFLALQAKSSSALSSRDPSVSSLKHCWDILKCENKTFLTLVTSAFPGLKEQEMLLTELRAEGYFDVFELNAAGAGDAAPAAGESKVTWGCFLCNHPERAVGFLASDGAPVIEGQLKEKKGRWRLFRRWRTRYFTLSGAHLSCQGSSGGDTIDINQIRSVKVSRGARNIPKAFEIFTADQTLILKPKDGNNLEEWVQCLSIAVAHSQAKDESNKSNSLPARGLTLKNI